MRFFKFGGIDISDIVWSGVNVCLLGEYFWSGVIERVEYFFFLNWNLII